MVTVMFHLAIILPAPLECDFYWKVAPLLLGDVCIPVRCYTCNKIAVRTAKLHPKRVESVILYLWKIRVCKDRIPQITCILNQRTKVVWQQLKRPPVATFQRRTGEWGRQNRRGHIYQGGHALTYQVQHHRHLRSEERTRNPSDNSSNHRDHSFGKFSERCPAEYLRPSNMRFSIRDIRQSRTD